MVDKQHFELMALVALVLLAKSLHVQPVQQEVTISEPDNSTEQMVSGERLASVELQANGFVYNEQFYSESQLDDLLAAIRQDHKSDVAVHSSLPAVGLLNQLNQKIHGSGGNVRI